MTAADKSKVPPSLIGSIIDLLTLYADLALAGRDRKLGKAGDHFCFKRGTPSSWANGATVGVGEDSIDIDVTLTTRLDDGRLQSATLDDVVDVVERPSKKQDLSDSGPESRHRIVRKIELRVARGASAPSK